MRRLLVDNEGLTLSQDVSAAHLSDQAGARRPLSGLRPLRPRIASIRPDGACAGQPLSSWAAERGIRVEVVRRAEGRQGLAVRPRRRDVVRTRDRVRGRLFARLGRSRRLTEDYGRRLQSAEATIELSLIHPVLRRLA